MRGGNNFQVVHQVIECFLDFDALSLQARVTVILRPHEERRDENHEVNDEWVETPPGREVYINFGLIDFAKISGVWVDGHTATWKRTKGYERPSCPLSKFRDLSNYDTIYKADVIDIQSRGELYIELPTQVQIEPVPSLKLGKELASTGLIAVTVEYTLQQNSGLEGFRFVVPQPMDKRIGVSSHRVSSKTSFGMLKEDRTGGTETDETSYFATRPKHFYTINPDWFPCHDSIVDRVTFELQVTLPSSMTVVCGAPEEASVPCDIPDLATHRFLLKIPILASQFAFAAGDFDCYSSPKSDKVFHYAPKGFLTKLKVTVGQTIPELLSVFKGEIGPFPFPQHSQVFVNEHFLDEIGFAGLAILSFDLLHDGRLIDQAFETTELMCCSLAQAWAFHCVRVKADADLWLPMGVAGYLKSVAVERLFGYSEVLYRKAKFRFHRDEHEKHVHSSPCPCLSGPQSECEGPFSLRGRLRNEFVQLKSGLVMEMLVQLIGSERFRIKFLREIGQHLNTRLTTKMFEKHIKRISSNKDSISEFFERWVYNAWCPQFYIKHEWKRKNNRNEFHIQRLDKEKTKRPLTGNARIVSYELESSTSNWIKLEEKDALLKFIVNSKPPRRNAVKRGKLGNDSSVRFVELDPDHEWLMRLYIKMDRKFSATQLIEHWDIKSQLAAISSLRLHPGRHTSEALLKAVRNKEIYYKVRLEAARAIAEDRHSNTVHQNTDLLMRYLRSLRYTRPTKKAKPRIMPNDFTDLPEYFLAKHLPIFLARIKDPKRKVDNQVRTKQEVVEMVGDLLKNNNNAGNRYSDVYYLSSLIEACGSFVAQSEVLQPIIKQIQRFLEFDSLAPSHRGLITQACLKAFVMLEMNEQATKLVTYREYTVYGKFPDDVRLCAFGCLVKLSTKPGNNAGFKILTMMVYREPLLGMRVRMVKLWKTIYEHYIYLAKYQKNAIKAHEHKEPEQPMFQHFGRPKLEKSEDPAEQIDLEVNYMPVIETQIPDLSYLQDPKNYSLADTLWRFLVVINSQTLQQHIYSLYYTIWGKGVPPGASKEQKHLTKYPVPVDGEAIKVSDGKKRTRSTGKERNLSQKRFKNS